MRVAVVIITYDRVADAKLLMYSIRKRWSKLEAFVTFDIYHVFNGLERWYPQKTWEDVLLRTTNEGHVLGAGYMLDLGIANVCASEIAYDFIIACSADVMIQKPQLLMKLLEEMNSKHIQLSTSIWFHPFAYATEFFVITPKFAKLVFPLDIKNKLKSDKFMNLRLSAFSNWTVSEEVFCAKTREQLGLMASNEHSSALHLIRGREYVFLHNRFKSRALGYSSFHNPKHRLQEIGTDPELISVIDNSFVSSPN